MTKTKNIMNKKHIFAGMLLMALTMGACTEDYKDWDAPQANAPEDAAAQYQIGVATGEARLSMDDFYAGITDVEALKLDSTVISLLSSSNEDISSIALNSVNINGVTIAANLKMTGNGYEVRVKTLELDETVRKAFNSRASIERALEVNVNAIAKLTSGTAVSVSGTNSMKHQAITLPSESATGYGLVGDHNGWNIGSPSVMESKGDGKYQITIETLKAASNFKVFALEDAEASDWGKAMGAPIDPDPAQTGFLICGKDDKLLLGGDRGEPGAIQIAETGHYVVSIDMVNYTYQITPATAYLYMAGDVNGWKQVDAMASPEFNGIYTGYMFLNQGGFKFCSEPSWSGTNYGDGFSTAGDAANITMTEAEGFYKIVVDLNAKSYELTSIPGIDIIGDATPGGWDAGTPMTKAQSTVVEGELKDGKANYWTITADLKAGGLKFRWHDGDDNSSNDWDLNWGGTPEQLTTNNGSNLPIAEDGNYTINFYPLCEGMSYCTITKN